MLAKCNAVKVVKKLLGERRVFLPDERGQMLDIAEYTRSSVNADWSTRKMESAR